MKKPLVAGVGEVLWDMLPDGKQLGGAPANFAWHAQQLGAKGAVVSAVGDDCPGREIAEIIESKGLINGLSVSERPTGKVDILLNEGIPEYRITENVAWDYIALNSVSRNMLQKADAICFGSLAQRSGTSELAIQEALSLPDKSCLRVFDINLRQHFYSQKVIEPLLKQANVLKINDEELIELKEMFHYSGDDLSICRRIHDVFDIEFVALTAGERGSILMSTSEILQMATPKVKVADTIGAGDAFTAALTMGVLKGGLLKEIHAKAVAVSAFVCTQKGAMPDLPKELV